MDLLKIPFSFCKNNQLLLKKATDGSLELLHTQETPLSALQEVGSRVGSFKRVLHDKNELLKLITETYSKNDSSAAQVADEVEGTEDLSKLLQDMPAMEDLLEVNDDAPIVRMINALLMQASRDSASDIHLEAFEKNSIVRFRVDGNLRDIIETKRGLHAALVSRIKIMAHLDIAEKRLPQDGRISLRVGGKSIDIRVSTLPTSHGERVVMRLLEKDLTKLNLSHLGMSDDTLKNFDQLIHKPNGIVLVTGPTGSGKSTTLYGSLIRLKSSTTNIMTVEDPVEYDLEGIGQTQVNPRIDMSFSRALRSILRQDPDIVMIGEIRDLETAQIAVQASLTGHLVLATLHTNDAPSAVTRLIDMGIEPFLLSSTLLGVLAQRLIRLKCEPCSGKGCEVCNQSGYSGRTGIYELMLTNDNIRELIHKRASEADIREAALKTGMRPLTEDGKRWLVNNKTTAQELLRVTGDLGAQA